MRIGQNPSKSGISAYSPKKLGIALITYIPSQDGYFKNLLDVFKIQVASLYKNTTEQFDLLVFDNGSCLEVQDELRRMQADGIIQWLILSNVNFGKTGAQNWIFAGMPNEWICYADSDFLFRKGWDKASWDLFDLFPDAGVVSGQPIFFENLKEESRAIKKAESKGYKVDGTQAEQWIVKEYAIAYGADEVQTKELIDRKNTCIHDLNGIPRAYSGACHMQYIARRDTLREVVPLPSNMALSTEEDREFDRRIDQKGWLRLSTLTPFVAHMGNHFHDSLVDEVKEYSLDHNRIVPQDRTMTHKSSLMWKILISLNKVSFMRKIFKRLYMNLFEYYSIK